MTKINDKETLLDWREKHISEKQMVLLLSFFVGAFAAFAAALLKTLIHLIQHFIQTYLIAG